MSRKNRIWYPGACYHITARGNRRSTIFYAQEDYHTYLTTLVDTRSKTPFHLHSYCLMPNHLHLQLETISTHIKEIMKEIHFKYAIYFNRRYDLDGHLFQGRYGAKVIKNTDYFLEVSKYIHLNPVEANIVKQPEDYKWSSYSAYISNDSNPYVTTSKTLSYFPEPQTQAYQQFIETKQDE